MVLVQKWPFFNFSFLGNIGQEKFSYDILKRKNAFLGQKKQGGLNRRKIDIIPKGLTNGFGSKMAIFQAFFSDNRGQQNIFYDILKRKNAFLGQKKKTGGLKRQKN